MGNNKSSSSLKAATRRARADQRREALYVQAIGLQVEYRTGRVVAGYDSFSSRAEIERKESRVYSRDILTPSERYCVEVLGVKNPLADIPTRKKTEKNWTAVYLPDGTRKMFASAESAQAYLETHAGSLTRPQAKQEPDAPKAVARVYYRVTYTYREFTDIDKAMAAFRRDSLAVTIKIGDKTITK